MKPVSLDGWRWRHWAWWGASKLPKPWLRASPVPIGLVAAIVSPSKRAKVSENLRQVCGPRSPLRQRWDVARTFVTFAQSLAESLAQQGNDRRKPHVSVLGEQVFAQALEKGRGVILATAHTAGWEVVLMDLERCCSQPVLMVMGPEQDPRARSFHPLAQRSGRRRVLTLDKDPLASLQLLHQLRAGAIVAVQIDRRLEAMQHYDIPIADKTWTIAAGPLVLSAATGAPIVLALARRTGFMAYELRLLPVPEVGNTPEDKQQVAEHLAWCLARHVTAYPTQWFDFGAPIDGSRGRGSQSRG